MARHEVQSCDMCGKPTNRIIAKLTLIPARPGASLTHSNYTAHADIGECCFQELSKLVKWQKRLKFSEYITQRKSKREKPKAAKR